VRSGCPGDSTANVFHGFGIIGAEVTAQLKIVKLNASRSIHHGPTQLCIRSGNQTILNVDLPAGATIDAVTLPVKREPATHRQQ